MCGCPNANTLVFQIGRCLSLELGWLPRRARRGAQARRGWAFGCGGFGRTLICDSRQRIRKRLGEQVISSIHSKLKDPLWGAASKTLRRIRKVTDAQDHNKRTQRKLDVKQTRQLDEVTLRRLTVLLP